MGTWKTKVLIMVKNKSSAYCNNCWQESKSLKRIEGWLKYMVRKLRKVGKYRYTKQPVLLEWGHRPYRVTLNHQTQMIDDGDQSDIWLMTKRRLSMGVRFQHAVSCRINIFSGLFRTRGWAINRAQYRLYTSESLLCYILPRTSRFTRLIFVNKY